MPQPKLVIIGNGMAAGRIVDEILSRDANKFAITVVGDESEGSYNRIMLSPVLAAEMDATAIIQKPCEWYAANNIEFIGGVRATRILRVSQQVELENGLTLTFDHLIIATGSRPACIAAQQTSLDGVMAFRTLRDIDTILAKQELAKNVVVIGGGLLGLEAAYGLARRGLKVTLVHRAPWLLNKQLDNVAGKLLRQVMAEKNIHFELTTEIAEFGGDGHVSAATLSSGKTIPCDLAIVAIGIVPNAELGLEAGLEGRYGIAVDDYLNTSDDKISAIGECVEHQEQTFGLVEPIWQQCVTLADKLVLDRQTQFVNTPTATKLKVSGVQVFSAGVCQTQSQHRAYIYKDEKQHIYRKLLLENDRIVGIVLFGDVRDGQYYYELMQAGVAVGQYLPQLLMGKAFCSDLPTPSTFAAA